MRVAHSAAVLDGVADVAWDELGAGADEVPGLLSEVAEDGPGSDEALTELFGIVWDQGTVGDVSAAAVPFLAEICAEPTLPVELRARVALVLFSIGRGGGYFGASPGARKWARRTGRHDLDAELTAEARTVGACHRAVEEAAAALLAEVAEVPPRLRAAVGALAAVAGDAGREAAPVLRDLVPTMPPAHGIAVEVLADLVDQGSVPMRRFAAVEAVARDLADRADAEREDGVTEVDLHSPLVDVLAEHLCRRAPAVTWRH